MPVSKKVRYADGSVEVLRGETEEAVMASAREENERRKAAMRPAPEMRAAPTASSAVPAAVSPPPEEPAPFSWLVPSGKAMRPAMQTLGAAGTLAGVTALGGPPGLAGGLLALGGGAAAGDLAAEALGMDPSASTGQAYRRAAEAAAFEPLAMAVGETGSRAIRLGAQRMAKLDQQLANLAEQYGIRMGVEDLTMRGSLRRMRNVAGRFPFIAGPFKESSKRVGGDIARTLQGLFDSVAPISHDAAKVSARTIRESREAWEAYRRGVNQRYENWRAGARAADARFSPNVTRQRAQELLDESLQRAALSEGKPVRLRADPLTRYAKRLSELDDGVSIDQYDTLKKDLQSISAKLPSPHDRQRIATLLEGLELDLRGTLTATSPTAAADVTRSLQQADRYFRKGKTLFETSTAQRMGRFRGGIFEVGEVPAPTTREVQESLAEVFNSGNRRAVAEYKALVGDRTFREATRLHLQDSFSGALQYNDQTGGIKLNMRQLSRDLGLFDPKSERRAALGTMLKDTGVRVQDIENLVRLAQRAADTGVVDVSTFVTRRAMLGGFKSAAGSLTPGADVKSLTGPEVVANALRTISVLAESRRLGRWLTDPRVVRDLSTALKPGLTQSTRAAAMIRVGRVIEQQSPESDFAVPEAGLVGGPLGFLSRPSISPVMGMARGAAGATQAATGAALSRAAGAPFRLPPEDIAALRGGR